MKRDPHPDLVRAHLKRWRTRLMRALTEVAKLEKALARAEIKRAGEKRAKRRTTYVPVAERRARVRQAIEILGPAYPEDAR